MQYLPCSSPKLLFGIGNPFFPPLVMRILLCWSEAVAFDAGGCEDLGHCGIHPDSTFVRWDAAVIPPTFIEGELRASEATHQRFHEASGTVCRFNLVVCRFLLAGCW